MTNEISYITKRGLYKDFALAVLKQAEKDSKRARNTIQVVDIKQFVYSSYFCRICDMAGADRNKKRKEILAVLNPNYTKEVFKNSVIDFFGNECGYGIDHVIEVCHDLGFIKLIVRSKSYGETFTEEEILCIKKSLEK